MFRCPSIRWSILSRFFVSQTPSFVSTSVELADCPTDDAVSRILTHLIPPSSHSYAKLLFRSLQLNIPFRHDVLKLDASEITSILDKLSRVSPENAIGFFFMLQSHFGIRHTLRSKLLVAILLAERKRPRPLRFHLQHVVLREGSVFENQLNCFFFSFFCLLCLYENVIDSFLCGCRMWFKSLILC